MDIIELESDNPFETTQKFHVKVNWGSKKIPVIVHKHINGETKYVAEVLDPEDGAILDDGLRAQWAESVEQWAKINGVGNSRKTD